MKPVFVAFLRGLYVFGLTWIIAYLIWWPIAIPVDRLVYWAPRMSMTVSGSPDYYAMLSDLSGAILFGPLMTLTVWTGYPTVVATAAVMAILLFVYPPSASKLGSTVAGVAAALLTSPLSIAFASQQTGSSSPNVDTVRLWHLFVFVGYPLACAFAGNRMGKPIGQSVDAK